MLNIKKIKRCNQHVVIFSVFSLIIIGFSASSFAVEDNVTIEGNLTPFNRSEEQYIVRFAPLTETTEITFSLYDSSGVVSSYTSFIETEQTFTNFYIKFFPPLFEDNKKYTIEVNGQGLIGRETITILEELTSYSIKPSATIVFDEIQNLEQQGIAEEQRLAEEPPYGIIAILVFVMILIILIAIKRSKNNKIRYSEIIMENKRQKEFEEQKTKWKIERERNQTEDQKIDEQRKKKLEEKKKSDDEKFDKEKQLWIKNEINRREAEKLIKKTDSKLKTSTNSLDTYQKNTDDVNNIIKQMDEGFIRTRKIYSLRKTSRFDELLNLCNEHLEIYPDTELIISVKIEILDILERYEEILPLYDQLSKLTPRSKSYQLKCKAEILIKMKQCAEAIRLCDESLALKYKDYTIETKNHAQFYLDNPQLLGNVGQNLKTSTTMLYTKIISRSIESIGYDENKKLLEIWFRKFKIYHYFEISKSTYIELINSESPYEYFNQNIRDKCEYKKMNSEIFKVKNINKI